MIKKIKKIYTKYSKNAIKKFDDIRKNVIQKFSNIRKNTVLWCISLYTWILNTPHNIAKRYSNTKQMIINIPNAFQERKEKVKLLTPKDYLDKIKSFIIDKAIMIVLLIMIFVFIGMNNTFLTGRNFTNILKNSSYRLLFALGVGTIIVGKGTDLSIGRVVGFTAMIVAVFSQSVFSAPVFKSILGQSPWVIIILAILVGITFGFINGLVVTKFNVDPFIATLGMMLIAYGGSYLLQEKFKTSSIGGFSAIYQNITDKPVITIGTLSMPLSVIISLVIAFVMWVMWNKTPLGKKIFAVGGNRAAAEVSGIKSKKIILFTFILGGALYGIGATFLTWTTGAVSPTTATMYELDAIAACIVGGLSFDGGKGRISGIIIGVLIFECISVGFTLINMQLWATYLVKGVIIIAAVAFDMVKTRKKR